jgi:hypothetical protein
VTNVAEPAIAWEIAADPGPVVAEGFDFAGCSDWHGPAGSCACETWRPVLCDRCGEEIHDGQEYGTVETLSWTIGSDEDAERDVNFWHTRCPR